MYELSQIWRRSIFKICLQFLLVNFHISYLDDHRRLCEAPHPFIPPGSIVEKPGQGPGLGHIMINECSFKPDICGKGKCIDTPTGYECQCEPGYRLGNSKKCEGK